MVKTYRYYLYLYSNALFENTTIFNRLKNIVFVFIFSKENNIRKYFQMVYFLFLYILETKYFSFLKIEFINIYLCLQKF